jgi:SH3-like domain-containing protein
MKKCLLTILALLFAVTALAGPQRLAVKVSAANVRSGPGDQYETIWQVGMYHPLQITEKKGEWLRFIDSEKDEGWIHQSLVANIPSVVTISDKCNIRSGPDAHQTVAFTAEKGVPFKVLERKKEWIHVEHQDGEKGWIHQSLVW